MSNLLEGFKKHGPLLVFLVVIVVCIGYGYIIWSTEWTPNNKIGDFGESFGAIDALFAGLAFAGLIYTILLQKAELQLQRKELKETRAEIRGQKETLQKQNFESSFFQLFGLHNEIVNSIEFKRTKDNQHLTHSGRDYFIYVLEKLGAEGVSYKEFFDKHQSHVGRYFSHLYNIIKFIDQSDITEKRFYAGLIRAQLSTNELRVFFYHGLNGPETDFKDLIERYALFEGMRSVLQNEQMDKYKLSAYGESV